MANIEQCDDIDLLRQMVTGWRKNAHEALKAENYTARIDAFLEVTVDARLFLLRRGELP